MKNLLLLGAILLASAISASSQVNSGSDGHDGAFNPIQNVEIDMADHPDGIYHYTSVNIPSGVEVTFKPNAANTPVVWLVQGNCLIAGQITLYGHNPNWKTGGKAGVGGYSGGTGQLGPETPPTAGLGPGGGKVTNGLRQHGGSASFGSLGNQLTSNHKQFPPGDLYGNIFLLPLIGGSGGGGGSDNPEGGAQGGSGGGGGGGAILIASSTQIEMNGYIAAYGGSSDNNYRGGGGGSGGAVRLVASLVKGGGSIHCGGGSMYTYYNGGIGSGAGMGRIRIDAHSDSYSGGTSGQITRGFQPIVIPPLNQSVGLSIQSVAGFAVAAAPTGNLTIPDVVVPAAQQNPVSIVVGCTNIPLGTEIIVDVKPANGPAIRAVGLNNTGTQTSSTATVQVQMPRGGGTIQAKAVSGIQLAANDDPNAEHLSLAQTGWTVDGERFKAVEVTGGLGVSSQLAYITESGKRYALGSR